MEEQKHNLMENAQKCVLLCLLALCANLFFDIQIFGATTLIFGSVFVLLALQMLPPIFASATLMASVISMIITAQHWQEIVVHLAEFCFIAYLITRRLFLITASALFWILVGTPLLWLLFFIW